MFKFVAAIFLLLVSPAAASNELRGQQLDRIEFMAAAHGVVVEKLNEADAALLDAATGPRPLPSEIYLLMLKTSVIIALVHDGIVVVSTDPIDRANIDKILGRTGA